MSALPITGFTATSCIGCGLAATLDALLAGRSGLAPCTFETARLETYVGQVPAVDEVRVPPELRRFDSRNNRLALLGLAQDGFIEAVAECASRWGARRLGLFLGTSTAGILETEIAYRRRGADGALPAQLDYAATHNPYGLALFVGRVLGIEGPSAVTCTACSSSAKVFGSAQRMIEAGLIDAAVVGGVDSLCLTTLYGFHALQLTSRRPCRPFDQAREGISIGEAAAFALLERPCAAAPAAQVLLAGVGESSDAYHMSSPHPEGLGARLAMSRALAAAALAPRDIDYINLHGTGTPSNDSAEGRAVTGLFGAGIAASSTKGATGHALGAAGALEAVFCALALRHGFAPGGVHTTRLDPQIEFDYLYESRRRPLRYVLSNSFGFGGSNCSLLLQRGS